MRQRIALAAHLPVSYTEIENYKNNVKRKIETAKLKSPYNRIRRSTKNINNPFPCDKIFYNHGLGEEKVIHHGAAERWG